MGISRYNSEGYSDPTSHAALSGIRKEEKAAKRAYRPLVYICSPFHTCGRMVLKLGIATTVLVGGALLADSKITLLTFFAFMILVSRVYDPLIAALDNLSAVIMMRNIQCRRMDEILSHPEQEGAEKLTNRGYDIAFDHVGFSYNSGETVLKDVSFTAKQGQVTALVGPSGGGKTTVSRLASRFWDIQKGKITVGGMDISKIDPESLMSLYSIVFQDVTLFNNTVMENIRLGRKDASDAEVLEAARLANVDEFAEKLPDKWNTLIGENGCELSGGERQRISIARAFLKDAPIILLDVKYSIVLMVYGVYRVREKRRIGTSYTNRKKNVYDVTWKRIRKILKSGIGSGSFFIP